MRLWTYRRPFAFDNDGYEIRYSFSFTTYTSRLYKNGHLIDELTGNFIDELKVLTHTIGTADASNTLSVSVGYINWLTVGIEVYYNEARIYASHPGKDIYFADKKLQKLSDAKDTEAFKQERQKQSVQWQKNKHSIFADIGLGAAFFIVSKTTGDLTLAAFTSIALGLALVVIQRFVKVDLLGGFAVFGTVMLLISALLSITFDSEFFVQLKGTIMGILGALVLLTDGLFRKGRYFAPRFERYLNGPVKHQPFVVGLGVLGLLMAATNYAVATLLSEDQWLTYTTFIDMPLYLILFFILISKTSQKDATKRG